jgi:hypothetical protein
MDWDQLHFGLLQHEGKRIRDLPVTVEKLL